MLALVDCNNFYASCERLFQPKLNNKPVIVLSNNDGCVIARSNEAKKLGIEMGVPAFKIKELVNQNNVHVFSTNFILYGDLSKRVMNTIKSEVKEMEVYSIDEAFMNFKKVGSPFEKALMIKQKVAKNIGIPVSIGVAPTKTLCKVANYIAKKYTVNGVFVLTEEKKIEKVLKWLPVSKLWGIGKGSIRKLDKINIKTAWDLCQTNESWIKRNMTVRGLKIIKELKGVQCFDLEVQPVRKKNICTSRSFAKEINSIIELKEAVSDYANACAKKLRKEKSCCNKITVFINTNRHKQQNKQYYGLKTIQLGTPTNDSIEIVKNAIRLLTYIYKKDCTYKKAGVVVGEIVPEKQIQLNLFDTINRKKRNSLNIAMVYINNNSNTEKVRFAIQGYNRKWSLKREKLSPCYSTRLNEALEVII